MPDTYEDLIKKGSKLDLFVYGTLQTGQPLHEWIEPDVWRKCPATTPGDLFLFQGGEYPAAFFSSDGDSVIHGEVITVHLTEQVVACIEMETRSGFKCRWVTVTFENGATQQALAFEFTNPQVVGERIEDGNWIEFSRHHHDQEQEFLATVLGDMISGDEDLYHELVDILIEEGSTTDAAMTEALAISDLELMMYNPNYNEILRDYVKEACVNLKDNEETEIDGND